jgi:glycosyltransferase involved in cell wall biosynthesis
MNLSYPDKHHPVYFLQAELEKLGATVQFHRNSKTHNCWGLEVNGRIMVWLIDNRWEHERQKEDAAAAALLSEGALVCHTQKQDAVRAGGVWLPLAATPGFYPKDMTRLFDVGFVGYVRDDARMTMLNNLASRFTVNYGFGLFGENALDTYCQSRAAVNIPTQYGHPLAYDVNMRVFECLATGIPVVTNDLPVLPELGMENGTTLFTYDTPDAIFGAVQQALEHPEVGQAGADLIQARHTYAHRAQQVMEWLS